MFLNLKATKTLGLTVPLTLQASADEVIEYDVVCCSALRRDWHKADLAPGLLCCPLL